MTWNEGWVCPRKQGPQSPPWSLEGLGKQTHFKGHGHRHETEGAHEFSATQNRRELPLYLLICLPKSLRSIQNKGPETGSSACGSKVPEDREFLFLRKKGQRVCWFSFACPTPEMQWWPVPVPRPSDFYDLHALGHLSPGSQLCSSLEKPWQGMEGGKREVKSISSYSLPKLLPRSPPLWPQPPGSAAAFAPGPCRPGVGSTLGLTTPDWFPFMSSLS